MNFAFWSVALSIYWWCTSPHISTPTRSQHPPEVANWAIITQMWRSQKSADSLSIQSGTLLPMLWAKCGSYMKHICMHLLAKCSTLHFFVAHAFFFHNYILDWPLIKEDSWRVESENDNVHVNLFDLLQLKVWYAGQGFIFNPGGVVMNEHLVGHNNIMVLWIFLCSEKFYQLWFLQYYANR